MSAIGDHLWQSTLFALAAGLLTLVLRRNRASDRYLVWLAASIKFLVPFSLLVDIGGHLAWSPGLPVTQGWLYFAVNEIGQPFAPPIVPGSSGLPAVIASRLSPLLPAMLAAVWFCGFGMVLTHWYLRWRNISAALRSAVPLRAGCEVEALRRMERIADIRRPIAVFSSPVVPEPGVFGVLRPVLLWPDGISRRLEGAHVEAVVAHEVWHVRRWDNLAAAMHMWVQAIFWFHPLVWWLGARLIDERERACDEKVVEMGSDRRIYAESILKICDFCTRVRLAGLSGVAGADLKKRIVDIMTQGAARELNFSSKLLLGMAAVAAVAVPTLVGSLNAAADHAASQAVNPDGSSSAYAALHANQDTPADTTMLQLLRAGSVTGTTCPNAVPAPDPFYVAGDNLGQKHEPAGTAGGPAPASHELWPS